MAFELPWWLHPWREARDYRAANEILLERVMKTAERLRETKRKLNSTSTLLASAQARLRRLQGETPEGVPATPPEFVLVGIARPGLGVRLIASRDMPGAAFGMTDMDDPPPRWQIRAVMAQPLFIDRPDYAAALDHLRTVWSNWDTEAAQHRAQVASRWVRGGDAGRRAISNRPVLPGITDDQGNLPYS